MMIIQHNSIVNSHYTMTLNEKRILLIGFMKITQVHKMGITEPLSFEITVDEWFRYFKSNKKNIYRDLKEAVDKLQGRFVYIPSIDTKINWIDVINYSESEGKIKIQFGYSISKMIKRDDEGNYTQYEIDVLAKLDSPSSLRIFEILHRWLHDKTRYNTITIKLDDLKKMLGLEGKYKIFADFNKRVLMPSIDNINESTKYNIRYEPLKSVGKIDRIVFERQGNKKQKNLDL